MSNETPVIVPPMLYLPVTDDAGKGQQAVVRPLVDGRTGLLAYTALDRLADKCGPNQAWTLVFTADIGVIRDAQPFDVVAFDIDVPAELRIDGRLA